MKSFSKMLVAAAVVVGAMAIGLAVPSHAQAGNIVPTATCDPASGKYIKLNNTSKRFVYNTQDENVVVTGACINVTRKNGRVVNALISGNLANVYGWSVFGVGTSTAGLQWVGGSDVIQSMNYIVVYTQTVN